MIATVGHILAGIGRQLASSALQKGFAGLLGPGPGAGGGGGGFFKSLFGLASGGSFTVGGSGGTDSQLVAFKASPNETVTVTRPDQGQRGGATIIQNINIDATGAQIGVAEQMAALLPAITKQASREALAELKFNITTRPGFV